MVGMAGVINLTGVNKGVVFVAAELIANTIVCCGCGSYQTEPANSYLNAGRAFGCFPWSSEV